MKRYGILNLKHAFCSLVVRLSNVSLRFIYYRPQRSCGQGNIFTPVCHSVHRGVSASVHAGIPPPDQTPGTRYTPPGPDPPGPVAPPQDQVHAPRTRHPPGNRHTLWTRHPTTADTPHLDTPLGPGTPPWDQLYPQTRHTPPEQIHCPPQTRHTLPGADNPPDQVHPPGPGSPSRTRYTLQDQPHPQGPATPPVDQVHPPIFWGDFFRNFFCIPPGSRLA